jgi:hypothetical protein
MAGLSRSEKTTMMPPTTMQALAQARLADMHHQAPARCASPGRPPGPPRAEAVGAARAGTPRRPCWLGSPPGARA